MQVKNFAVININVTDFTLKHAWVRVFRMSRGEVCNRANNNLLWIRIVYTSGKYG